MAHFAQLDEDNIVQRVIVINNDSLNNLEFPDSESIGIEFCKSLCGQNTRWAQTSYNNNFRKFFACMGGRYDSKLDIFVPPSPYPSWVFNESTYIWEAPVPYPDDGKEYYWNESITSWSPINTEIK